jgi:hypothetical protein
MILGDRLRIDPSIAGESKHVGREPGRVSIRRDPPSAERLPGTFSNVVAEPVPIVLPPSPTGVPLPLRRSAPGSKCNRRRRLA